MSKPTCSPAHRQTTDSAVMLLLVLLPLFTIAVTNAHGVWLYVAMAAMLAYVGAMLAAMLHTVKKARARSEQR